jgi:hypothetical protein
VAAEPGVHTVEPAVDTVEAAKELALELLEHGEGERLVRHGEILLPSFEHRVSNVAAIGDEGRKGRERPAATMLTERGEAAGPFEGGEFFMYAEPEGGGPLVYYRVFLDHGQVTWVRPCNRLGQMGAKRYLPTYRRP